MPAFSNRRRRRHPGFESGLQRLIGWLCLGAVLATILWNGGTPPVAWTLLGLTTLVLFAGQVALDFRQGVPSAARAALWVALSYAAVLVWLHLQSTPGLFPGAAHPVWALAPEGAQPAISANPDAGRQVVMRLGTYGLVFWILLRSAAVSPRGGGGFIEAIALFSTALALYGLVSKYAGYNLFLDADDSGQPVRASFVNRNSYATFAVFGVLANVTAYARAVGGTATRAGRLAVRDFLEAFFARGWVFAFGALMGLGALAMSLSRGGVVALVAGLAVLLWGLRRRHGGTRGGLAELAVPLVLVGFVAAFMTAGVVDRVGAVGEDARPALYLAVLDGIAERPWLGHGAGAFADAFRAYAPMELAAYDWEKAHSTYLENAFEFGLPAAIAFFTSLGLVGARLLAGVRTRRRNRSVAAFALACFVAGAVHSLVDFSLQIPANAALFAGLLGLGWGQSFRSRAASPDDA